MGLASEKMVALGSYGPSPTAPIRPWWRRGALAFIIDMTRVIQAERAPTISRERPLLTREAVRCQGLQGGSAGSAFASSKFALAVDGARSRKAAA
jgi:hypothetical protein